MRRTTKRLLGIMLAFAVLAAALVAFAGCAVDELKGVMTIVLDNQTEPAVEITVDLAEGEFTTRQRLLDVLFWLGEKDEIDFNFTGGVTGAFLSDISSKGENAVSVANNAEENKWLYIYTSVKQDEDVSAYKSEYEYDGVKYVNSGVGASHMHLESGAVIIFTYIVYGGFGKTDSACGFVRGARFRRQAGAYVHTQRRGGEHTACRCRILFRRAFFPVGKSCLLHGGNGALGLQHMGDSLFCLLAACFPAFRAYRQIAP